MSQIYNNKIKYRPDIDGLRALAVLSVVFFHAFPELIHGGFIGVDIFFVISGYLISSIIFKGLENESFSFVEFYSRRIKRIFPAITIVLAGCLIFGWFALIAEEYEQLGKHSLGASTFTNNFMFWTESGYFDKNANTKPLLHLWSLSIEEQFYLFWPLFLWWAYKWRSYLGKVLIGLVFGFTLLHFYIFYPNKIAAFYAPYSRFFEFLIGAFIAYQHLKPKEKSNSLLFKRFRSMQSLLGLVLILIGIHVATKSHFPGWYALLSPVLGTALIIDSPEDSLVNKQLLSNKIVVWIGLISYPLYLWHWPLLSYSYIVTSQTPLLAVRVALVISAFLLAILTYHFIEKPFRFRYPKASKQKVIFLVITMITIGTAGILIYEKKGVTDRKVASPIIIHEGDIGQTTFFQYLSQNFYSCSPQHLEDKAIKFDNIIRCFQSKKNQPIDIAIIGDSHAEALFIGLSEELPLKNIVYYTQGSLPVLGNVEFNDIFDYVLSNPSIKTIVLNAYWDKQKNKLPKHTTLFNGLSSTAKAINKYHKHIIITDDIPVFSFDPKQCKFLRPLSFKSNCIQDKGYFDKKYQTYTHTIELLKKNAHITVINTVPLFCNDKNCTMTKNDKLLYRDENHLNIEGSRYIGKFIAKEMKGKKLF